MTHVAVYDVAMEVSGVEIGWRDVQVEGLQRSAVLG
jgi:hypothetical protein